MEPKSILKAIQQNARGLAISKNIEESKPYLDTLSHLSYLLDKAEEKDKAAENV